MTPISRSDTILTQVLICYYIRIRTIQQPDSTFKAFLICHPRLQYQTRVETHLARESSENDRDLGGRSITFMPPPDDDIEVVLVVGVGHQGLERFQLGRIYRPAPLKLVFALKWSFGFSFGDRFEF